jgi:hypothetical protein
MAFAENMAFFMDTTGFAVTVTFAGGATANAIFDREYYEVEVGGQTGQEATQPQLLIATADLPNGFGEGSAVTVANVGYTAKNVRNDGTGATVIDLFAS